MSRNVTIALEDIGFRQVFHKKLCLDHITIEITNGVEDDYNVGFTIYKTDAYGNKGFLSYDVRAVSEKDLLYFVQKLIDGKYEC